MEYRLQKKFPVWLFAQFKEFWPYYVGALLCLGILHSIQSQIPALAKEMGDYLVADNIESAPVAIFFYLAIGLLIFRTLSRLLFFYPARVQQKLLRTELFQMLESFSPYRYKDYSSGQLFQIMFNDINELRALVGFAFLQVGNIVIAFSIFIPKINDFNPALFQAFTPMIASVVIFTIVITYFQPWNLKLMNQAGEVTNSIIESYNAKASIKNYQAEKSFINLFAKESQSELDLFFRSSMGSTFGRPLNGLGYGLSLIWGAYLVKDLGLESTSLIFFSGFLFLVLEPLAFLSWIGFIIARALAAWKRIKTLTNQLHEMSEEEIELKQTSFDDAKLKFWDDEIHLNFQNKNIIAIVGETGVGKTFILTKLAELLLMEGREVSYVGQETYLYNDSIKNNIMLGDDDPEALKLVEKYISLFELDVLGNSVSEILHMEVGENGKKVSGGQAKRLSLLRSIASSAEVLIWDDPFSSVDLVTEKTIFESLKRDGLLQGRTLILSSHRLSSIKQADYVYLLDTNDGILEQGDSKTLLSQGAKTYEFFQKQLV